MKLHEAPELYEKVISENEEGTEQVKLTINTFYDTEYLHLRKYYLDFEILSLAESKSILETHFKDILDEIYLP